MRLEGVGRERKAGIVIQRNPRRSKRVFKKRNGGYAAAAEWSSGQTVDKAMDRQWTVCKDERNAKRFEVGRCNSTDVANDSYACCTAKIGVIGGGTWNWRDYGEC